jgi:hypothetical protein
MLLAVPKFRFCRVLTASRGTCVRHDNPLLAFLDPAWKAVLMPCVDALSAVFALAVHALVSMANACPIVAAQATFASGDGAKGAH